MKSNSVRHDKFWAGISQDDRLQSNWEFTYWQNVNIRQGQFVELEKKPVSLYSESQSWSILCQFYSGKYFLGCSDGKIRTSTDLITFTEIYTPPNDSQVLGIQGVWTNLFWFTQSYMYYRTTYTDSDAWVTSTNVFQITANVNNTLNTQIIHYSNDLMYFTNWKTIWQIDTGTPATINDFGSFTSGGGAFAARSELVGITEHANSFWVYDNQGRMYVVDQWIQAVTSIKNFKEPIIGVYNNSDYDLVITQSGVFYKAMYKNWGVWPSSHSLFRRYMFSEYVYNQNGWWNISNGIRFNFTMKQCMDASFAENNTIVYLTATEGGEDVIYAFGKKNNSLPEALSILSSKRSDGGSWGTISAIWSRLWNLYVAGNDGVTLYVEAIPIEDVSTGETYQSSGYLITRVDTLGIYEKPKQAGKLTIGADIPDWTSIKIYYSME